MSDCGDTSEDLTRRSSLARKSKPRYTMNENDEIEKFLLEDFIEDEETTAATTSKSKKKSPEHSQSQETEEDIELLKQPAKGKSKKTSEVNAKPKYKTKKKSKGEKSSIQSNQITEYFTVDKSVSSPKTSKPDRHIAINSEEELPDIFASQNKSESPIKDIYEFAIDSEEELPDIFTSQNKSESPILATDSTDCLPEFDTGILTKKSNSNQSDSDSEFTSEAKVVNSEVDSLEESKAKKIAKKSKPKKKVHLKEEDETPSSSQVSTKSNGEVTEETSNECKAKRIAKKSKSKKKVHLKEEDETPSSSQVSTKSSSEVTEETSNEYKAKRIAKKSKSGKNRHLEEDETPSSSQVSTKSSSEVTEDTSNEYKAKKIAKKSKSVKTGHLEEEDETPSSSQVSTKSNSEVTEDTSNECKAKRIAKKSKSGKNRHLEEEDETPLSSQVSTKSSSEVTEETSNECKAKNIAKKSKSVKKVHLEEEEETSSSTQVSTKSNSEVTEDPSNECKAKKIAKKSKLVKNRHLEEEDETPSSSQVSTKSNSEVTEETSNEYKAKKIAKKSKSVKTGHLEEEDETPLSSQVSTKSNSEVTEETSNECKAKKVSKKSKSENKVDLEESQSAPLSQVTTRSNSSSKKRPSSTSSQDDFKVAKTKKLKLTRNSKSKGKSNSKMNESKIMTNWLSKAKPPGKVKPPPSKQKSANVSDSDFLSQFPMSKTQSRRPRKIEENLPIDDVDIIKRPSKVKTPKKKPEEVDEHQRNLDRIVKVAKLIEANEVERLKCEKIEKTLHDDVIHCSPKLIESKERLSEMENFLLPSTIMDKPPGFRLFKTEDYHSFFHTLEDLDDSELNKLMPKILSWKGKNFNFVDASSSKTLDKLFKVTAYLGEDEAIKAKEVLEQLLTKHQDWLPKIRHIITALINCGLTIDEGPYQETFLNHRMKLNPITESERDIFGEMLTLEDKERDMIGATNLILIFEVLISCFEKGRSYTALDLRQLVVIVTWIRMDRNYIDHVMLPKMQNFCSLALDAIKESMWPENMEYISTKLVQLHPNVHHHNLAHIAEFLPATERGIKLRQATSFKALHQIYKIALPKIDHDLEVREVYNLVKKYGIHYHRDMTDYYETHSIIRLIGYCLHLEGNYKKETEETLADLKQFARLLYTFFVPILDCFRQQDTMKIKNDLLALRCKITLYYCGMDVKEASMERLMDNTKCISPLKRNCKGQAPRNLSKALEDVV